MVGSGEVVMVEGVGEGEEERVDERVELVGWEERG